MKINEGTFSTYNNNKFNYIYKVIDFFVKINIQKNRKISQIYKS